MSFRSRDLLETWVDEFRSTREGGVLITVLVQDGAGGADTGIVTVPLRDNRTTMTLRPPTPEVSKWSISFASRPDEMILSAAELHAMAAELVVAAALCQFLATKSMG